MSLSLLLPCSTIMLKNYSISSILDHKQFDVDYYKNSPVTDEIAVRYNSDTKSILQKKQKLYNMPTAFAFFLSVSGTG